MVTDNASVMAQVAHSSVSPRVAAANEKWMGCLFHQLNTAMKCCVTELVNQEGFLQIFNNLQTVEKILRIFEQSNWNSLLPEGFVRVKVPCPLRRPQRWTTSGSLLYYLQ